MNIVHHEEAGDRSYITVHIGPGELVTASGKPYPFATCLGTIRRDGWEAGKLSYWKPVGYKPRGYVKAARAMLEAERDVLIAAGVVRK